MDRSLRRGRRGPRRRSDLCRPALGAPTFDLDACGAATRLAGSHVARAHRGRAAALHGFL